MTKAEGRALYLDASAILKLVVRAPETEGLLAFLSGAVLISSEASTVEVGRAARLQTDLAQAAVRAWDVLRRFYLVSLDADLLAAAARAEPPDLRILDAIHLAAARRVAGQIEAVVTYDPRLARAAAAAGLEVASPG